MQSFKTFKISSVFVAILLVAGLASGQQSLLAAQGQVLSFSGTYVPPIPPAPPWIPGDVAPGLGGDLFGGGNGPLSGVMDDAGRVLWRAQLVDSVGNQFTPSGLGFAYFYGDSRANIVKVIRGGEAEPSGTVPAAVIRTASGTNGLTGSPRLSGNGIMFFGANFWDPVGLTITNTTDSGLYLGTPGSFSLIAREGDPAPGCGGDTYTTDFGGFFLGDTGNNSAGQVVFRSNLSGAVAANQAWFTGSAGNIQLMLRKGALAPGLEQISSIGNAVYMNASGQVLIEVTFVQGTGTIPVTTANDKALWIYTPGSGFTEIMREGGPTAIPGVNYGAPSMSGSISLFNNAGEAAVGVSLAGPGVTVGVDDFAIFLLSTTGSSVVVRKGDAAPGIPGSTFFSPSTFNMQVTNGGTVAFMSTVAGGGVLTTNDSGLWVSTSTGLVLVAREGDVAPGSGGQTFGAISAQQLHLNAAGQVMFNNSLSASGNVQTMFSWDPVLGLRNVWNQNDSIEVQPAFFKAIAAQGVSAVPTSNGDGRSSSFANDGTMTLRPFIVDGCWVVMKVRVGSLTPVAKTISASTGGTQNLYLNAGIAHGSQLYAVIGSASGTNPGTPFGSFTIPLNFDGYTDFTVANWNMGPYVNTVSFLNADGFGLAQIVLPPLPPVVVGLVVHHAYGVLDGLNNLVFVSEPASLTLVP